MVELTFALPLLVVMLFGVMEFGRLFVEWQIVQSSARSGARSASLYRAQCVPDAVRSEVTATVNAVLSANPLTKARTLEVEVSNPCSTQASQLCCVTVRLHTDLGVLQSIVELVSLLARPVVRRVSELAPHYEYSGREKPLRREPEKRKQIDR